MAAQSQTDHSAAYLYDVAALVPPEDSPYSGIRLPDGRTFAWAEYGSPRSMPCVLLPDGGSSRLAPYWLLHDEALPAAVRLLAIDRPGVGASDPVGLGGREDPGEDLRHLVETLAVGRVALIGIGQGAEDAMTFAVRYPTMVTTVQAISPRMRMDAGPRRGRLRPASWSTGTMPAGPVAAWLRAIRPSADLTEERTWARAVRRMDSRAAAVLGDRWRDADFRADLAADLSQSSGLWTSPASAPAPLDWTRAASGVPVHIWHGRDETGTTLGHVRGVAARRFGWQVSVVDGCSAVFGAWAPILHDAADSFGRAAA